ncbi:NBR1-Ig-like domain-containing protein [Micromonospora sp. CA-240977]|uniref:NBR1-Ig-like domain-containing protein n=1 Tax=Micromonospora sp. CA-240977 TaxID=3239957 RepID=UPI003D91A2BA
MEDQRAAAESIQDRVAAEEFAEQLRTLRNAVGNPSFRKMAGRSGRISHTTLHEAAAGTRFPSWETTREFVRACEADEAQWRRAWEDAQRQVTVRAVPAGEPAPVGSDFPTDVEVRNSVGTDLAGGTTAAPSDAMDTPSAGGPVMSGVVAPSDHVPGGQRALRGVENPQTAEDKATGTRRHRSPWLAAAAVMVVVSVAAVGVIVRDRQSSGGAGAATASPTATPFSDALIAGDSSKFVADATIPDGTQVPVNATFVKVWTLANVGKVDWHNRFLARTNPTADADGCRMPDRVPIGDTPPGEKVNISVQVTAPNRPGKCWVSWKMVDEYGKEFFPSRRPVYFMVNVTA